MNSLRQTSHVLPIQQDVSQTHFCLQLTVLLAHSCYSDSAIFLMLILLTFILHSFPVSFPHKVSPLWSAHTCSSLGVQERLPFIVTVFASPGGTSRLCCPCPQPRALC